MKTDYLYLAIAIMAEVAATSALKAADGFSRLTPSIIVVVGYALTFYLLSITLRTIAIGVVYAIWSGCGIALLSIIGLLYYKQSLDLPAIAGIGLILAGIMVLNLSSTAAVH
jgi:small multidrug resistance pump